MPYGNTEVPVRVADDNFFRIVEPQRATGSVTVRSLLEDALDHPVGGVKLADMVRPGVQAGIIIDPLVPADVRQEALSLLTTRLSSLGVARTKVFARKHMSWLHNEDDEVKSLDPTQNSFSEIGKTAMGTPVDLDPELLACDMKIMVGLTRPHFVTGFTGGPDVVIPIGSSIRSITRNRSLVTKGFPDHSNLEGNIILTDLFEACRLAEPIYSVSFIPSGWGGITNVFAGEIEPVFRESVAQFTKLHSPRVERKLDIVIVSAGTFGVDLYHAVRVVSNVLGSLKKGGTVILVAECSGGIGDSTFLNYARRFHERKELAVELRHRFKLGAHVNLFLQELLERCRIQIVSVLPELFVRDEFGLKPSQTASEAVQKAIRLEGKESKILIVPRGDLTIPIMELSGA